MLHKQKRKILSQANSEGAFISEVTSSTETQPKPAGPSEAIV